MRRGPGTARCPDLAADNGVFPTDILGRCTVVRRGPFALATPALLCGLAWLASGGGLPFRGSGCAGRALSGQARHSWGLCSCSWDLWLSAAPRVRTRRGAGRAPAIRPPPPRCRGWLASRHQSKISNSRLFSRRLPGSSVGSQQR